MSTRLWGTKYQQTVAMLRKRIREGNIITREPDRRLTCYFCRKPIERDGIVLLIENNINNVRIGIEYSSHQRCYDDASRYMYDDRGNIIGSLS